MTARDVIDSAVAAAGGADEVIKRLAADGVTLVCGSDLKPVPIEWLWAYWLALGKLHILAGPPGQGKTTIAIASGANVTIGGCWPDGSRCAIGNVLFWSAEDDPADTLLPRFLAAGGDPARLHFVIGARIAGEQLPFDPARDMVQLTEAALRIGNVRLMIVDPVVSAVTGDSHKNTEVRRALQPLVDLASNLHAAVLGISHFSKGTGGRDPTERVTGSVAFGAVARVVMVASKVKGEDGNEDRRIFARAKSNIGPDDGGFEYSLEQVEALPGISASRVRWGQAIEGTARELLTDAEANDSDGQSAKDSAENFLRELLSAPTPTKTVQAEARQAGHSWATVRRAADALVVIRRKAGMGEGWYWSLPEGAQKTSKVLTESSGHLREEVSTFGGSGQSDEDHQGDAEVFE
ncbi:MAG: AAA family ATPase [Methylibium sp.]|uniref:AAA family ATPase n=1 Tax=Methylibium sp. TaxID=2067992 RepID=UPI0017C8A89A|nr:AAA family ATPase [Methylibium sp.]MBA3597832.1 AAA family ATPase [Methylibium sp.]